MRKHIFVYADRQVPLLDAKKLTFTFCERTLC